jgi:hypothetical protein
MFRVDYVNFFKPLLRACGLALLAIFLISSAFSAFPFQFFGNPGEAIKLMVEFLERSNLLAVAVLLILLSLADKANPPGDLSRWKPPGLRDRLFMKARLLVGIGALFYLAIIPYTLVQAQLLQNVGIRVLDSKSGNISKQLKDVKKDIEKSGLKDDALPLLKQKYSWINSPEIRTMKDLKARVEGGIKQADAFYNKERSTASFQLYGITLRTCLLAAIHTALLSYFWFYWPRAPRPVKQGRNLPPLGVEEMAEEI